MKNRKALSGWRYELETHPILIERDRRVAARKRALETDKEFAIETAKLRNSLEWGVAKYPKYIRRFLHHFSFAVGTQHPELDNFLNSVESTKLRKLFQEYVKYVARFGVVLHVSREQPQAFVEYLVPFGRTLHVRLVNGHFEPGKGHPGGGSPFEIFFESDDVQMPTRLQKQIKSGKAKFVLIDDSSLSSVLAKMEYFAYDPECLTFILHKAEQPYLLCLVGEKVTDKLWASAKPVVSAFLRENFNRGKAGRPKNLPRFRRTLELRRKPGLIKEKLALKGENETAFFSEQSYSARAGKLVRVPE